MKASAVPGLRPDMPTAVAAAAILRVRLDELRAFDPAFRDPGAMLLQHDMRIAAKRVRYLLDLLGPLFGTAGKPARRACVELQTLLGDLHDLDALRPYLADPALDRVRAELDRRRAGILEAVIALYDRHAQAALGPALDAAIARAAGYDAASERP